MSNQGWIKLHRQILDNEIWDDGEPFSKAHAWIDLLLTANHESRRIIFDGNLVEVKRGQKITSVRILGERWHWSAQKVLRFLKMLEALQMITRNANSRRTLITIVNYDKYQGEDENDGTLTEHSRDTHGTLTERRTLTNKNVKNDKNEKKEEASSLHSEEAAPSAYDNIAEVWNTLPEPVAKVSRITKGSQREKKLHRRILDYGEDKVKEAIENIRGSTFLMGGGARGWVINFDWFISPENFPKVLEGTYTDKQSRDPPEERDEAWENVLRWMNEKPTG